MKKSLQMEGQTDEQTKWPVSSMKVRSKIFMLVPILGAVLEQSSYIDASWYIYIISLQSDTHFLNVSHLSGKIVTFENSIPRENDNFWIRK